MARENQSSAVDVGRPIRFLQPFQCGVRDALRLLAQTDASGRALLRQESKSLASQTQQVDKIWMAEG